MQQILIGIILVLTLGGYWLYQENSKLRANNKVLEGAVATQEETIKSIQADFELQTKQMNELSVKSQAAQRELNRYTQFIQNYELTADNRDNLKDFLSEKNIGTLIQWGGKGVHQFHDLGFEQKLPNTEKFFDRCIMLPMNIFISNDDVEYICDSVRSFYNN